MNEDTIKSRKKLSNLKRKTGGQYINTKIPKFMYLNNLLSKIHSNKKHFCKFRFDNTIKNLV